MDGSARDRLAAAEQQASNRLRDLQGRVTAGNQDLYRHLALYLQVLRQGLLPLVQQACFHLITTNDAGPSASVTASAAYAALPEGKRLELQDRIRQMVARCTCLLTVEQLAALAQQRQRREADRRQQGRRAFLEAIQNGQPEADAAVERQDSGPQPWQHSVDLTLEPPVSADLFTHGLPGLAGLRTLSSEAANAGAGFLLAGPGQDEEAPGSGPEPTLNQPPDGSGAPLSAAAIPGMEALIALASTGADLITALAESRENEPAEADDGRLPSDPEQLLRWWQQFDQALAHRLRTLSHALNGLLVRNGMCRTLIPIPLLDAVLQGQLGALPAPANLVKVQIPMPMIGAPAIDHQETVIGILVRPSDLEFELPPLRTCRQRLEQHRRELRRMAQQFRDWQRRHQSIQAQMLWETDLERTLHQQDENA